MKCVRCNRPMLTPAATVQTRAGLSAFGPKCAAVMGILPAKANAPVRRKVSRATVQDERQADWVMEVM